MRVRRKIAIGAFILTFSLVVGTICHEAIGHGLVGVLVGARVEQIVVLGVQLWPTPAWVGFHGFYGICDLADFPSATAGHLASLGGSLSTWLVAVVANVALWLRRWRGWPRVIVIAMCFWWIDLVHYLLPVWGIRTGIFFGRLKTEPYDAAIALGIPGFWFLVFALGSSLVMAIALAIRLRIDLHVGSGAVQM